MGADATWPLQQGILSHLKSCNSLKEHLGDPPQILEQTEKFKTYPKLVLGGFVYQGLIQRYV